MQLIRQLVRRAGSMAGIVAPHWPVIISLHDNAQDNRETGGKTSQLEHSRNSGVVGFPGTTTVIAEDGSVNHFMQPNTKATQSHGFRQGTGNGPPTTGGALPEFAIAGKINGSSRYRRMSRVKHNTGFGLRSSRPPDQQHSMSDCLRELRQSNDVQRDTAELQRRLEEDGYLFLRGLLDREQLLSLRRQMLTLMQAGGWLVQGTDPVDGIANPDARSTEGDTAYTDVYHQVYRLQAFHEIAHSRGLIGVLERIRGCTMMPQPQNVARLWFPKFTEHTTPIHQDFVHFQGTHDNLTCWSPIGDCPRELGGLAVIPGSHKVDRVLEHHFSLGAGSLHVDPAKHSDVHDEWHTTDYKVGDTLIFPALTIHKALPNLSENRLRVSLDNRYQRIGDPIAEHMLNPHLGSMSPLTWDDVYENWDSDEFQYYWMKHNNPILPKITEYLDKAFDEAVEMTRNGDQKAQLHLRRIAIRDPSSDQGQVALKVLSTVK